jgi:hypothetical protein
MTLVHSVLYHQLRGVVLTVIILSFGAGSFPLLKICLSGILLTLFVPEDEGVTAYRNNGNDLPVGVTFVNTGHTQNNGAALIVNTIKTAPLFCVFPVFGTNLESKMLDKGKVFNLSIRQPLRPCYGSGG